MKVNQFYKAELEADVLGTLMSYPKALNIAMMKLDVNCFWNNKNKTLFSLMASMWKNNKVIDLTTVLTELGSEVEKIGVVYISDLASSSLGVTGIKEKCDMLILAKKRYEIYKLYEKIGKMFENEDELDKIISQITSDVDNVALNTKEETGDIMEAINGISSKIKDIKENGLTITGIPTGYYKLDNMINGLKKEEMIVLAGRPSIGKSTVANNIAINVAMKGKKVAIFNLEMSKEQVVEKMMANMLMIEFDKIAKGRISNEEMKKINHLDKKMADCFRNIKLYDRTSKLESIIAQCRILSKKKELDLLIIDYMQLLETNHKANNREQEIAYISRSLKILGKELKINIIALSQLSRAVEGRADKRPMLSDLRESGSIEQDSDIVIMCYRDEYYNKETEERNVMELVIPKNRAGETGAVKLAWLPEYQKVGDLNFFVEEKYEEAPF